MANGCNFANHLAKFTGQTVTIFTTSGGISGSGFTGVLMSVNSDFIRLLTKIGSAPPCSISNPSSNFSNNNSHYYSNSCNNNGNYSKGSLVDIPISSIVSFVHNSI